MSFCSCVNVTLLVPPFLRAKQADGWRSCMPLSSNRLWLGGTGVWHSCWMNLSAYVSPTSQDPLTGRSVGRQTSSDTFAPVLPAIGPCLPERTSNCSFDFCSTFPTPARDCSVMPEAKEPFVGNWKLPKSETSFKVPILVGALAQSIRSFLHLTPFIVWNLKKKLCSW